MLRHIILCNGYLSGDLPIVHLKQLRSIKLFDAVAARNFVLWEALGTLPTLEDLTLVDHSPLLLHVSENSNSQSGGPRYFEALESLCVTSSIHFIRHLLNFIDSPCLKSIKIDPVILSGDKLEPEDLFTPLTIVSSKWSQSLKNLAFRLDLTMKTQALDYDVMIRLWSWPLAKLRTLNLNKSLVSLGALKLRRTVLNCVTCIFNFILIWILLSSHLPIPLAKAFTTIWRISPWTDLTHLLSVVLKQCWNVKLKWHDIWT